MRNLISLGTLQQIYDTIFITSGYAESEKLFFWVDLYARNYFFGLMLSQPEHPYPEHTRVTPPPWAVTMLNSCANYRVFSSHN